MTAALPLRVAVAQGVYVSSITITMKGSPMTELDLADLFELPEPPERQDFLRGRWGWGRIVQPDGTYKDYPRISTLADQISSGPGLNIWRGRHIALGVARNPDIAAVIAGLQYGDEYIDNYIEDALEREKTSEPANYGTAVHKHTEPDDSRAFIHPDIKADVAGYDIAMAHAGITCIEANIKIVNDRLGLCGTADGLYQMPDPCIARINGRVFDISGKVIIGDAKTGQNFLPVKWAVQKATYATGVRYDVNAETRSPLHPNLDPRVGLVIYIQLGTGTTVLKFVDLEVGYKLAELCKVLHAQGSKGQRIIGDVPEVAQ